MGQSIVKTKAKSVNADRIISVNCNGVLDVGELINTINSITEINTTDLIFSNESINNKILVIENKNTSIGEAIQFLVSGGVLYKTYWIELSFTTNSTPPQICKEKIPLYIKP